MRTGIWSRMLAIVALVALAVPLAVVQPVGGDGDDQYDVPEKVDLKYPNLGYHLDQLVAQVETGEASAEEAARGASISQNESVAVTIYLSGNVDDVVTFLEDNGGDPRNVGEDYIEAYVPLMLLGPVSEQPGVIRVREIVPSQPDLGPITSQGVQVHGSTVWNQAGLSGQDIKVGIIDLGFEGFRGLMGTELPATVVARCYTDIGQFTSNLGDCGNDEEHGTAVAEAVMDIAPEVSLYVATPKSDGDRRATVQWMASQGVTVLNRSAAGVFEGPGDGNSPFTNSTLKAIDEAVDAGIVWVNSAGNGALSNWFGRPRINSEGFLLFTGDDFINEVQLRAREGITVQLRWDDRWGGASSDFDLGLFHTATSEYVALSRDAQLGRAQDIPFEVLLYDVPAGAAGQYEVIVTYDRGAVPRWIQVNVATAQDLTHFTVNNSLDNPAESANLGMLAVGAAPYFDVHTIEPFSSRGPTPDGRTKPDIVGADCGATASYEEFRYLQGRSCWFPGTSQAAPHVAGMAALVRQRFPDLDPEGVADYLKDHAERRGTVPNNTWGYGFAQLPSHDAVVPATVTLSQDTVLANQTLSISGSGFSDSGAGANRCIQQGDVLINNVAVEIIEVEAAGQCRDHIALTSSGTFTMKVLVRRGNGTIPDALLTSGTHEVVITDTKGVEGRSQVTIPIRELDATPRTARPGDQITITGQNFPAGNPDGSFVAVDITYDCGGLVRRTVSGEPDASGNFEETLPVPDDCGVPSTNTIRVITSVDGVETVVDTIIHDVLMPEPTPTDPCGETLSGDGSVSGEWASGCESQVAERGHARYYTFTLAQESEVTITLESQDADTYLYLRAGEARSGDFLHYNDDDGGTTRSTIQETLAAGTYTIEATTYGAGRPAASP